MSLDDVIREVADVAAARVREEQAACVLQTIPGLRSVVTTCHAALCDARYILLREQGMEKALNWAKNERLDLAIKQVEAAIKLSEEALK